MSRSTRSSLKSPPYRAFTFFGTSFQKILALFSNSNGLESRVQSPLLTGSRLISIPPATEMFHFAGCLPLG